MMEIERVAEMACSKTRLIIGLSLGLPYVRAVSFCGFKPLCWSFGRGLLRRERTVRETSLSCSRNAGIVGGLGMKNLDSEALKFSSCSRRLLLTTCKAKYEIDNDSLTEDNESPVAAQVVCWAITAIYVGWLFILPYAPGDPAWAISPSTIQMLIDLSLNFFFVLPLTGILADMVGIHGFAPVVHPVAEGLFNFVLGWTLLFAPLLFTDRKRDRFGGSLEALWIIQMLLTNTVLAPYMAIRASQAKPPPASTKKKLPLGIDLSSISGVFIQGAYSVGLTGAAVGLFSVVWALYGRPDRDFGGVGERWNYLIQYAGSERLAYAFVWDIVLYCLFQPWLIGDNLSNVRDDKRKQVEILRFVPYVGLVAYVLGLEKGRG